MTRADEARERVARAHTAYHHELRAFKREHERAGAAVSNRAAVEQRLSDAADVFAAGDWHNLSTLELAAAGGRIERLARQLAAADRLPAILERKDRAKAELTAARKACP